MPRLFGKDPSKETVQILVPHGSPRPEFTANNENPKPGECPSCGGWGSVGFVYGNAAGRVPCQSAWHTEREAQ